MVAATIGLLYRLIRRKANPVVAIVVTMIAAAASSIHWLARPHLFTLLFLVLFYAALRAGQRRADADPAGYRTWRCSRWRRCSGPTCTAGSSWES